MSGLRKAAVILMSLSQDEAGKVMSLLTPKQVEVVSIEIAKLSRLGSEEQEATIREFAATNPRALAGEMGGLDKAKALVETRARKKCGGDARQCAAIDRGPAIWISEKVDAQNLLTFIVDEHPQTIALILSHLPPTYGAQIVGGLSAGAAIAGDSAHCDDGPN